MASGGSGIVIVESTALLRFIDLPEGSAGRLTAEKLRPLVDKIHAHGAMAVIQLFPKTEKVQHEMSCSKSSDINCLSTAAINDLINGFIQATQICVDAGFDGVELHGAHNFLLCQFSTKAHNRRTDVYGEKLFCLACQIIDQLRRRFPNTLLFYRHTIGASEKYGDAAIMVRALMDAGLDVLDLSPAGTSEDPARFTLELKSELRKIYGDDAKILPIISVGGMENTELARKAIAEGRTEFVAVGRAQVADYMWTKKVHDKQEDKIVRCFKCNVGCFGNLSHSLPISCIKWSNPFLF